MSSMLSLEITSCSCYHVGMSKTVLITGATGGLGRAFANLFAAERYTLVLVGRDARKLTALRREIAARFPRVTVKTIVADLSHPGAAESVYRQTERAHVTVDVLVNNAGFATHGAFVSIPLSDDLEQIAVNITAATAIAKLYGFHMAKRRRGKILNVASVAAYQPGPYMAVYYASKAYVLSLSEAMSAELSPRGVTVTALAPGATKTGFAARAGLENTFLFRVAGDPVAVAEAGYHGLMEGKRVVIPGLQHLVLSILARIFPHRLVLSVLTWLQQ